ARPAEPDEARLLAAAARHRQQTGEAFPGDALRRPGLGLEAADLACERRDALRQEARRGDRRRLVHEVAGVEDLLHDGGDAGERRAELLPFARERERLHARSALGVGEVAREAIARELEPLDERGRNVGCRVAQVGAGAPRTLALRLLPAAGAGAPPRIEPDGPGAEPQERDRRLALLA